jgi:hypothetical protein|uniref:Uncharacterized protein n=1 Tax=viral metagenome TaxID=1070528 RepID=A0A6C0IZB3_9ZZZZ
MFPRTLGAHSIAPSIQAHHVAAAVVSQDRWAETPDEQPVCDESTYRCEIWVPSPAFTLPTENEKKLAAKNFALQRGQRDWNYVKDEKASKPGYIVVRRPPPVEAEQSFFNFGK